MRSRGGVRITAAAIGLAAGATLVLAASGRDAVAGPGDGFPNLTNLCKFVQCPTVGAGPHIDSVQSWALLLPIGDTITPGGILLVKGQNFGAGGGSVSVFGLRDFVRGDIGPLTLDTNLWKDDLIVATVPLSVTHGKGDFAHTFDLTSGLADQTVTIRVDGTAKRSNTVAFKFRATRDAQTLPMCDVPHLVVDNLQLPAGFICATSADYDACNDWHDADDTVPSYMGTGDCHAGGLATLGGYHQDNWCCQFSPDEGVDVFPLALKNGWVFDEFTFTPDRSKDDVPFPDIVTAPIAGNTAATVRIHWLTNANDFAAYSAVVGIEGPRGVPWK